MSQVTPKCANKRQSLFAASKRSMVNDKMAVNGEVLNSWKEVAVYLGRGVRTVQRWELDLGLPVRRPRGKPRSAIIALKPELDRWLTCSLKAPSKETIIKKPPAMATRTQNLHTKTTLLMSKTKRVMERSIALCAESQHLCERLNRTLIFTARQATQKQLQPPVSIQHTKAGLTL